MRIRSNTRVELGRLFACLEFGERIAHDCALRQAEISNVTVDQRFLTRQARQEQHHGRMFQKVVLFLTPRGARPVPEALQRFGSRLEGACRRGDLLETLVGQQIVLESFGEFVLHRLNDKLDQRHVGFRRMRRILMHQEQGHHTFGVRLVGQLLREEEERREHVIALTDEYLHLMDEVIDQLEPLFEVVGADATLYKSGLRAGMPRWNKAPGS